MFISSIESIIIVKQKNSIYLRQTDTILYGVEFMELKIDIVR